MKALYAAKISFTDEDGNKILRGTVMYLEGGWEAPRTASTRYDSDDYWEPVYIKDYQIEKTEGSAT